MSKPAKSFLLGLAVAAVFFGGTAFVFLNLRETAAASKSKRLFSQASYIDDGIQKFRTSFGRCPASKRELVDTLRVRDDGFDYFRQGDHYTLIYPSLTGSLRWEPYVVQDGRLAAYPAYMESEIKRMGLARGSALPRR